LPLRPLTIRRAAGVTLIEMLIGLAIVGIGLTVAMPSFQGMIARNTVATDVNEMLLAVNLARSEAGRTGSRVSIRATGGTAANEFGPGWCVVATNDSAGDATDCNGTVIRAFPGANPNATLNLVDAGGETSIDLTARGALDNFSTVSIDYCYEGQQGRRIFVSPIGRSKSHRPDDVDTNRRPDC
jgi:type IV fimbrial biogenesis protein FimT